MPLRNGFFILLLTFTSLVGLGQVRVQPLPEILSQRRSNTAYLDSLSRIAKKQYNDLTELPRPRAARNDTLRFKALYYLGRLYRLWPERRDSTLYFSRELETQARQSRNLFYELNGKLLLAEYYRADELNTPLSLRLNLEILPLIPQATAYKYIRYQANLNLGKLYRLSKDYANALWHLSRARSVIIQDTITKSAKVYGQLIDLEQNIGAIHNQQGNLAASEKHYRAAESLLTHSSSPA